MVQDVKNIRPELYFEFVGDGKILHPRDIPLEERRATKRVTPDVAKRR